MASLKDDLFKHGALLVNSHVKYMFSINSQEDFAVGRLYPDLERIKEVSIKIATKVAEEAYKWVLL